MKFRPPASSAALHRCRALIAGVVFLLLFQLVAPHARPVVVGVELCTGTGVARIGVQEHHAPDGDGAHHDCCCSDKLAPPPVAVQPSEVAVTSAARDFIATSRLAAQWLGPLSRGPPPHS